MQRRFLDFRKRGLFTKANVSPPHIGLFNEDVAKEDQLQKENNKTNRKGHFGALEPNTAKTNKSFQQKHQQQDHQQTKQEQEQSIQQQTRTIILKMICPLGNRRNTVSRVLCRKRELTKFCGKLGEFCEKLAESALAHI